MRIIEKYNLQNEYIKAFEGINKNCSAILFNYRYDYHINFLKSLNINWSDIQTLIINEKIEKKKLNYNYFYHTLFSFNNLENNLTNLTIYLNHLNKKLPPLFDNINNFKLLERLELRGINIDSFSLKLSNLKELYLYRCFNFKFYVTIFPKLKIFHLVDCTIITHKYLINFPELETLEIYNTYYSTINYNLLFNCKNLKKLKYLKIREIDFLNFENSILENIEFVDYYKEGEINKEIEKIIIKKLLFIKTLKNINGLHINYLNETEILSIGCNESVIKLKINLGYYEKINFLDKLFPNLTDLNIEIHGVGNNIQITEDINSKINKISIIYYGGNIFNVCQSFENLIELNFYGRVSIYNIIDFFPIFNNNCKIIFHSLIKYKFKISYYLNDNAFKNLYKNLDCFPALEEFEFICFLSNDSEKIILNFIEKLLKQKFKSTVLSTTENYTLSSLFSNEELRKIYPEIEFNNYKCLKIYKSYY